MIQPKDIVPFNGFDHSLMIEIEPFLVQTSHEAGTIVHERGDKLLGLYLIQSGEIEISHAGGERLTTLEAGMIFGERGLLRDGLAIDTATCRQQADLWCLPSPKFTSLLLENQAFANAFDPTGTARASRSRPSIADGDLTTTPLFDIMTPNPVTIDIDVSIQNAARMMRDHNISCVLVTENDRLAGIVTTGDMSNRVVADGLDCHMPVAELMTAEPFCLPSHALGFDAFLIMTERRFGHLPVVDQGRIVGILTRTNIIRRRSISAVAMIAKIAKRKEIPQISEIVGQIPQLLVQLAGGGTEPKTVGRLVTGIADATTRRLLRLAETELGAAPIPYVWAACGSQGRQEQTGVSDQDNCLILDDGYQVESHGSFFQALAQFVCDGLDACGYFYCPGDMMASNARWRTNLSMWKSYFTGWINKPDPMAQMLASVMFDLRPIHGNANLLAELQTETLQKARANTIFMAHLTANSLKHAPPLGLFGGLSTIRSGENKNRIDLKIAGVVPIVDLGRIYALKAAAPVANTRERLELAREAKVISQSGAADLIDAYDLICETRLHHQARQARQGHAIDNFMAPSDLSELERNHLRQAFAVVKTMQAAAGQGQHMMS